MGGGRQRGVGGPRFLKRCDCSTFTTLSKMFLCVLHDALTLESITLSLSSCRAGAWAAYNRLLTKQPMFTKALTSLTGFTLGDFLAQTVRLSCCPHVLPFAQLLMSLFLVALSHQYVEKVEPYDLMRTARLGSFGLLVHGPTGKPILSQPT